MRRLVIRARLAVNACAENGGVATLARLSVSIREAIGWIDHNTEAAHRTQITYLELPEAVALNTKIVDLAAEVTPAQMQWWIDAVHGLGLIKNNIALGDVLAD